jgi:hypothetical protein
MKILISFYRVLTGRYAAIFFDTLNPPVSGDTITVGKLVATFLPLIED